MTKPLTVWFWNHEGILPWFEANQGLLSVLALATAFAALYWEFRQAEKARVEARVAKADAEARDRRASLMAARKEREDRVKAERNEIGSFCFALEQIYQGIGNSARLEIERLRKLPVDRPPEPSGFLTEGRRAQRAIQAILLRPPTDQDAVLAACRGLDAFEQWNNIELIPAGGRADEIERRRAIFKDAATQLEEARNWAGDRAFQWLEEIAVDAEA
jgi:hypothetical protein